MSLHLALPKGGSPKLMSNWVVLELKEGKYYKHGQKLPVPVESFEKILDNDVVEQFFSLATQNSLLKSIAGVKNGTNTLG